MAASAVILAGGKSSRMGFNKAFARIDQKPIIDCFIVPCDMPFVSGMVGNRLIELAQGFDGVVPILNGHFEPLCAVYKKTCIPAIRGCLVRDIRKVIEFFHFVNLRFVEASNLFEDTAKLFCSVNTPTELVKAGLLAQSNLFEAYQKKLPGSKPFLLPGKS